MIVFRLPTGVLQSVASQIVDLVSRVEGTPAAREESVLLIISQVAQNVSSRPLSAIAREVWSSDILISPLALRKLIVQ